MVPTSDLIMVYNYFYTHDVSPQGLEEWIEIDAYFIEECQGFGIVDKIHCHVLWFNPNDMLLCAFDLEDCGALSRVGAT